MTKRTQPHEADNSPIPAQSVLPFETNKPARVILAQDHAPYRSLEQLSAVDLTLFVACYNEENNIVATIETVVATMQALQLSYEMIVIDDGSKDQSAQLIMDFQQRNPAVPLSLVSNGANRGLSRNFAEGAFLGQGRFYKLVCGDNVESKENLISVIQHAGKADIIVPYHQNVVGRSWMRRTLSKTYTALINLLSGHSLAYYNGCGVYRRVDVMRWHSRTSGFGFQAELLTRLLGEGATYLEVPTIAIERQGGSSSAMRLRNWVSVGGTLLSIFLCRFRSKSTALRTSQQSDTRLPKAA